MKTLGIIGHGSFGKFAAEKLAGYFEVKVYDRGGKAPGAGRASLQEVCQADYVMLAIPLSAYESVLGSITSKLAPNTVVLDISSVKVEPLRLLRTYLSPKQPYIAMHPLFGPESAAKTLLGFPVVFCESNLDAKHLAKIKTFCIELGLEIVEMSADKHDRQMAVVHALTFFVARALNQFGVHEMRFRTPSFNKLVALAELDRQQSDDLFKTILLGNKYALETRRQFMKSVEHLDDDISNLL